MHSAAYTLHIGIFLCRSMYFCVALVYLSSIYCCSPCIFAILCSIVLRKSGLRRTGICELLYRKEHAKHANDATRKDCGTFAKLGGTWRANGVPSLGDCCSELQLPSFLPFFFFPFVGRSSHRLNVRGPSTVDPRAQVVLEREL